MFTKCRYLPTKGPNLCELASLSKNDISTDPEQLLFVWTISPLEVNLALEAPDEMLIQ